MTNIMKHTAYLHVDLDAICHNWQRLNAQSDENCHTGAVVKADAYGLGMAPIATALYHAGCRHFFTARADEACLLDDHFKDTNCHEAHIIVFDGILEGQEPLFESRDFLPTLNNKAQLNRAKQIAADTNKPFACIIHIDTAMTRLGFGAEEWQALCADENWHDGLAIHYLMSHLASADDPDAAQNKTQLALFHELTQNTPYAKSLANSGGVTLGQAFHFSLTRPGLSIYGLSPLDNEALPDLRCALYLSADILQIRDIKKGTTIGYGATFVAPHDMRVATLGIGYADGLLRHYKDHLSVRVHETPCPVIGRISMDSCVIDITHLPDTSTPPSKAIIFDKDFTPKDLASAVDTIAYEIITTLGERVLRLYDEGDVKDIKNTVDE